MTVAILRCKSTRGRLVYSLSLVRRRRQQEKKTCEEEGKGGQRISKDCRFLDIGKADKYSKCKMVSNMSRLAVGNR
jgi:hypothetical protein